MILIDILGVFCQYFTYVILLRLDTFGSTDHSSTKSSASPSHTGRKFKAIKGLEKKVNNETILVSNRKQKHKISNQLQIVQSTGSRGLRLSETIVTSLSFPASQIFTNCDFFPAEFSLVVTIKTPRLRQKVN